VCRWNSGRSEVKLNAGDPLFEGFDCEDSVQSFMQIIQTAMKHKDELLRCGNAQGVFVVRTMLYITYDLIVDDPLTRSVVPYTVSCSTRSSKNKWRRESTPARKTRFRRR